MIAFDVPTGRLKLGKVTQLRVQVTSDEGYSVEADDGRLGIYAYLRLIRSPAQDENFLSPTSSLSPHFSLSDNDAATTCTSGARRPRASISLQTSPSQPPVVYSLLTDSDQTRRDVYKLPSNSLRKASVLKNHSFFPAISMCALLSPRLQV